MRGLLKRSLLLQNEIQYGAVKAAHEPLNLETLATDIFLLAVDADRD